MADKAAVFVRKLRRDHSGASAVEFALIAPLLFVMLFGIIQFGLALNNYVELTDAVRNGGRNFAISRAAASTNPYTTTSSSISSSAANLTAANIHLTVTVNGTACTTDSGCATALSAAAGDTAVITATYPCNLTVMGVNMAPSCTLSATTSDLIE
ncbi:MAG TPA: TadE/TadG family type IV pilus assembly protein [Caulobacteraceae bacterium]|jgi:Flp pilus assembly protein TadG|nr:TadE/TadG family type IV pilus assembly protein [Caulobacteraceae bacterium]